MATPPSAPTVPAVYPVAALLASSTLWGLTWLPLKHFADFGVLGVSVSLVAYGSVGAIALIWLTRRVPAWRACIVGLSAICVCGGVANVSFASAMARGDVVRVMVLFYLLPAWGVIGGYFMLHERVDAWRKLSVGAALVGAFLILGGFAILKQPPSAADALAVLSGIALALTNVLFRKYPELAVTDKIAAMFVGCLLLAIALTIARVERMPVDVPSRVWAEVVLFGLCWLSLATMGTQWGVAHMEAGRSSVLIIMELVATVVSASLINGTQLAGIEWVGGVLIGAAALIEARRSADAADQNLA